MDYLQSGLFGIKSAKNVDIEKVCMKIPIFGVFILEMLVLELFLSKVLVLEVYVFVFLVTSKI